MDAFSLTNANGMEVRFIAYGGAIVSVRVPDRRGAFADVTPGYDSLEGYVSDTRFFGALIGRYANRIANGRFTLDGVAYSLPVNDKWNHLHGGPCGFHTVTWRVARFRTETSDGAVLCYRSPAGEQGYPGTLVARVTYTLTRDNELVVEYSAICDEATPVNLTQHSYFNLAGHDSGDVLEHELTIAASHFTPVDSGQIPTGEIRAVRNTPFDFTTARAIGSRLDLSNEQLQIGQGYDVNFVLDSQESAEPAFAARLYEPRSGRLLEIFTTEPGLQLCASERIHDGAPGKRGIAYPTFAALALETQHFPDSPNHASFPSTILLADGEYRSRTIYRFSVQ